MANKKGYLTEIIDWTTDIISVSTPILNALGIPVTPQATIIVGKTLKLFLTTGVGGIFNDFHSRQLSSMQKGKLEELETVSLKTVYKMIENNGWDESHPEASLYTQNYIEYAEDLVNKAMNECRQAKRLFLGAYLGSTIYTLNVSNPNWENVYYLSSLINKLTIRQIFLLKLISENFDSVHDSYEDLLCITDKVAISELKELSTQNMWVGLISYMPNPTHIAIPLKYIVPTELCKNLVGATPMPESLNGNVEEIIKSLELKPFSQCGLPDFFRGMMMEVLNPKINLY